MVLLRIFPISYNYKLNPIGTSIISSINSNTVNTNINLGSLTITKAADKTFARRTDIIKYGFLLKNIGTQY